MNLPAKKPEAEVGVGVYARVETITVERARQLLERLVKNRPLSLSSVRRIIAMQKAGAWKLNGEPFIIGRNGEFLEGQHRATAIIQSGIPMVTLVVYGVDPDAFDTINTGRTRKPRDIVGIEHEGEIEGRAAEVIAGTLRLQHVIERRLTTTGATGFSNAATRVAYDSIGASIEDSIAHVKEVELLGPSQAAALHYVFKQRDAAAADKFMTDLASGAIGDPSDPVLLYRNILIRSAKAKKTKKGRLLVIERLAMGVRAWNARRAGTTLKQLKGIITVDGNKTFPYVE